MAWPPPVLPVNRTDALYQEANHPADHNAVNQAMNDTRQVLGAAPAGTFVDVSAAVAALTDARNPNYVEGFDHWASMIGVQLQASNTSVTINAAGDGHVSFPVAFGRPPVVVMSPGDLVQPIFLLFNDGTRSVSGFDLRAYFHDGNLITSATIRVGWLAVCAR